jgi:hypothetical protein
MFKSAVRFASGAILSSIALCASADPGTYQDVTISGVFQETVVPSARCASGQSGNLAGFGASAELGRIAFLSTDCFAANGPVFTFSNGKIVLTTISGDVLFADYGGQVVATGVGTKGVLNGATFQVTGGTGKYKHAQGAGTLSGTEDLATGQGTLQLKGRILLKD